MGDEVFTMAVERIRTHCQFTGQRSATIVFHGGEPCLVGPSRIDGWCSLARQILEPGTRVRFAIQTNGTLLDDRWAEVLKRHRISVGISMDGPPAIHDAFRLDHHGRGSYDAVARGMNVLRAAQIPFSIFAVMKLGADSREIHQHFLGLDPSVINYLFPDQTYDDIETVHRDHGPTPAADFLLPILKDWWASGTLAVQVNPLWSIARLILGGSSDVDVFGNAPLKFVFIEGDGEIEGLDVLRVCGDGFSRTGLNVLRNEFRELITTQTMHADLVFRGTDTPAACRGCREETTCAGGYVPHRFSRTSGFENRSVWCADILLLFDAMRDRLGVSTDETALRRQVLTEIAASSRAGSAAIG